MNMNVQLNDIARAIRNLIRTGIVTAVNPDEGLCRVQTGGMQTTWLNWLTCRAGRSRVWWAPSVGEQVLILAIGGELDNGGGFTTGLELEVKISDVEYDAEDEEE